MGIKDKRSIQEKGLSAQLMVEKLNSLGGISFKNMFGGQGIFKDDKMFCIVDSAGNYFFKVNDANKSDFEKEGSVKHSRMPYFSVPQNVFDDYDMLITWAKKCINN